uniref:FLYWCH-type domain-containing protein n=1 Tax=Anopheles atroparvus TaxID=41427 RepID=A0A182JMH9_ANOAO
MWDIRGLKISGQDAVARFSLTQRGRPLLVYDGFSFIRNGEFMDTINWRCSYHRKLQCKAKAITMKMDDEFERGPVDSLVFVSIPLKNRVINKIFHNRYYYTRSKKMNCSTYWVCDRSKQDNCRGRITIFDKKRTFRVTNPVHNHPPQVQMRR